MYGSAVCSPGEGAFHLRQLTSIPDKRSEFCSVGSVGVVWR